ncbi:hypothetical protein LTR37_004711 [Vermiconidia calcicola]|uniref:Uncharacterized protein n=1 Tax=Vermiconidia calcicola TaxID=1690605 RepID=A0ACC3NND2_9PEZI|nr:hypothetical protein LTR37_004711 [Vermiconidia calcicola]
MASSSNGVLKKCGQSLRSSMHLNFYRVHLLYFILTILISSGIFYGSDASRFSYSYTDALFLCVSAMCNVGLNTVNLSSLTGFQQSILYVLMFVGDLTVVTISVVIARRFFFTRQMSELVEESGAGRRIAEDIEEQYEERRDQPKASNSRSEQSSRTTHESTRNPADAKRSLLDGTHLSDYGSFPAPWHTSHFKNMARFFESRSKSTSPDHHHYLSFQPELDHKGRFTSLNEHQRNELGGVEYRALKVLSWLLPAYTLAWLGVLMVALVPYAMHSSAADKIRDAQPSKQTPAWWAAFVTLAGYTNTGLNLLDANMIPLRTDYSVLIITGAAILAGNTFYPVFLRLCVWLLSKAVRKNSELHHSLSFLLQHPRRCYLLLFPAKNTWILFGSQVAITLTAWIFWVLLNIDQPAVDPGFPPGPRTMDGLYQALGLRSCGFYVVHISDLAPALQFFYLLVMYISAFPVLMSLRHTNIYEERSLGQDDRSKFGTDAEGRQRGSQSQLGVHIRKQLAYDIWWLCLAVFLICIVEHKPLRIAAPGFSIFSVIFEVVSAYGNIGLSLGVPYSESSFSAAWHVLSKLILLTVMLRGRHRILPMAVDRAVLIPGQELMEKLDKEYATADEHRWKEVEHRIREDERGAQAESSGTGQQQDPEQDDS